MPKTTGKDSNYLAFLNDRLTLKRRTNRSPLAIDLFAGCGGLALGLEAAGFRSVGFELDANACATYTHNLGSDCRECELAPGFDYDIDETVDVVAGGPPCQPFSVNGYQSGPRDSRDGFPAFLDAVERLQPRIAVFENVRGMLYRNKAYLHKIVDELRDLDYIVETPRVMKAVEYGVPQRRERLIVVAHRSEWQWPSPKPGAQFTAGEALGGMAHDVPDGSKFLTESMDRYVANYERKSKCVRPRDLHLDEPSRTVTCRNLNGATADMMRVRLDDGRRRRLTVREGARLQSFPDWFEFQGSEGSQFNQVGNAVPPILARAIGDSLRTALKAPELSVRQARSEARRRLETDLFGDPVGIIS